MVWALAQARRISLTRKREKGVRSGMVGRSCPLCVDSEAWKDLW